MATSRRDENAGAILPEEQERLRRETDAAVRLEGEMMRRLSRHGMRGIDEMVELHERLRRAADAIALPEIDFALGRIASLSDRLRLLRARLDRLAAARRAVGGEGAVGAAGGHDGGLEAAPSGRNGRGSGGPIAGGSR